MRAFFRITLKTFALLLLLAVLLATFAIHYPLTAPPTAADTGATLIRNLQRVDLESGEVEADISLLLEAGRIVAMGADLSAPGAQLVDAGGAYAIPGLFDMHVHSLQLSPALMHPLYIAAGVTAVRDMGGCLGDHDPWVACAADKRAWNSAVAAGTQLGPRYDQVTSLAINGGMEVPTGWDPALGAATAAGARQRVALDAGRGIDFLKPYTLLPREGYLALAKAAAAEGMYLAGHKPLAVSAAEAINAGQRSIEHAFLFIWECYPGRDQLRSLDNPREAYTHETRLKMLSEHDPALCDSLYAAMAANGTAFVPTHTTRKLDAYALDPAFRKDARLRYVPAPLRTLWLADADGMAARTTEAGQQSYRQFYEFGLAQTGRAHNAGVTVLAGTDAPDSFAFPGFALHDELEHLVQAGLTPREALRAATVEPARFLGLGDNAGVIAPGARADIVVLRANPLEDIRAVRDIQAVVLAGRVYDREHLDRLLAGVEQSAGHWTTWVKFAWQALRSPIFLAQARD